MNYIDVMKYCLAFPNAERQPLTKSGNAFALMVNGTAFGYFETGAPIQWQFTLRVSEVNFETMPNPPMVRKASKTDDDHWLTIERVENFNGELLKELIAESYQRASVAACSTA